MRKKHQPGCPCCTPTITVIDCATFRECFGYAGGFYSADFELQISGVVNGTCSNCSNINGTFILSGTWPEFGGSNCLFLPNINAAGLDPCDPDKALGPFAELGTPFSGGGWVLKAGAGSGSIGARVIEMSPTGMTALEAIQALCDGESVPLAGGSLLAACSGSATGVLTKI